MSSITMKNIEKVYPGNVVAVHDFNLEIEDKEFVILVGPSGCGKSTMLRMIAGLEDITKGELSIGDKVVNDVDPKDRNIAMVFQSYALYPHMTVYKNMAFALKIRKLPKDEIDKKVREAAKILDIEHLLDRKPKALSGGQRQRVALGRAMVREPDVFLLDEPLSNLDAKLRAAMRSEIVKLHKRLGTTFVYVTHDQTEAMTMGDKIVVMRDGYIMQVDTPQNLYDYPNNLFVAGFIGTPQMNFMDVTLVKEGEGFACRFGSDMIPVPTSRIKAEELERCLGKELVLGIRPEDIHEPGTMGDIQDSCSIKAEVDLTERMGSEVNLYLSCNGCKVIAKAPSRTEAKDGQSIEVVFDCGKIHLFDKESESVLLIEKASPKIIT